MIRKEQSEEIFARSIQLNDGFRETSADGVCLAFDKRYGIMFCVYMPGKQCCYGESRSKIVLAYFPATQPHNVRYITVTEGRDEFCPNIMGIGDGKVRVFYVVDSYSEGDQDICYKDFDFQTETLSEEKTMMVKCEDGKLQKMSLSLTFSYLEERGYHNHSFLASEQISIGSGTYYKDADGVAYGVATSYLMEPVLFRSYDNMATVEFFAVYPYTAQYEFDYKILNGKIYGICRTENETNSITFSTSEDMGKTWSEPIALEESINCRPRIIHYDGELLMAYNYYNDDAKNHRIVTRTRNAVKLRIVDNDDPNKCTVAADLINKWGLVNVSVVEILGIVYIAYSTSELPVEYINYDGPGPVVNGKDSMRYVKLGYIGKKEE
ncbi:MAG: exo-alpha-sialidase [Clostridia bacterium]|nr:exo-alpha-sialidase [Clostridia bacterium]